MPRVERHLQWYQQKCTKNGCTHQLVHSQIFISMCHISKIFRELLCIFHNGFGKGSVRIAISILVSVELTTFTP